MVAKTLTLDAHWRNNVYPSASSHFMAKPANRAVFVSQQDVKKQA